MTLDTPYAVCRGPITLVSTVLCEIAKTKGGEIFVIKAALWNNWKNLEKSLSLYFACLRSNNLPLKQPKTELTPKGLLVLNKQNVRNDVAPCCGGLLN